nr:transposase family protein [Actinocrispum wychmicini]
MPCSTFADQAPDLHEALQRAQAEGLAYVILDGKIFSADRCGEKTINVKGTQIDLWYSGKAHEHGGNVQGLSAPSGFPLWAADVEPGSVHDLTVARDRVLGALYYAAWENADSPS